MKTGKVSEAVLKRSVLRQIDIPQKETDKGAGIGKDCAFFSFPGMSAAAFSVQPFTLNLSTAEGVYHAILAAINNVAAGGGIPAGVLLSVLLPPDREEDELKGIMKRAEEICRQHSVRIMGGHTEVTDGVTRPIVTAVGIGAKPEEVRTGEAATIGEEVDKARMGETVTIEEEADKVKPDEPTLVGEKADKVRPEADKVKAAESTGIKTIQVRPGQDIVVSKWIGLEGTALIAKTHEAKLLARYPAALVAEARAYHRYLSVVPEAACALKSGVCAMHDVRNGGIFGALWELAERTGVGLKIDLKKIPVKQETIEICELVNANPYELLSGGMLLMITDVGRELVDALELSGIPATVIGTTTDNNDRVVINAEETRFLTPPKRDEIYRILEESSL